MSYAKEKFSHLPRILSENKGTIRQRVYTAFLEVLECKDVDFPTKELCAEFSRLRGEASTVHGDHGRIQSTLATWTDPQLDSMKQQLLALAARILAA
jgi:hypothetical protein